MTGLPARDRPRRRRQNVLRVLVASWVAARCFGGPSHAHAADPGAPAQRAAEVLRLYQEVLDLYRAGKYREALPLAHEVVRQADTVWGQSDPSMATSLQILARLYQALGDYPGALPFSQRALVIWENARGPEHRDTAAGCMDLAELYGAIADYKRAVPLAQRALAILEQTLGPEDPDTATSLNNLAGLYGAMADYKQAVPLARRAVAIYEKVRGPEDPDTATGLTTLATLYQRLGDYRGAEPLLQRALAIYERTRGPEHPHTAAGLNNLAVLYEVMGDYAQAVPLCQRALATSEKVNGPEHPNTATSLGRLGTLYLKIGDYARAVPLAKRALAIGEKALRREHPDSVPGLLSLVKLYREMGDYAQALPLAQRALMITEKVRGPEHPDAIVGTNDLAQLYTDIADYAQALPLAQRVVVMAEKVHGPEHPETPAYLQNLGVVFEAMGDYARALPLYKRALMITEKVRGPEHSDMAKTLGTLATLYRAMGDDARALPLLEQALAISEKVDGSEHPATATGLHNLAGLYSNRGDYAGALPLYQRALMISEKVQGPEAPDTAAVLNDLALLHKATGDYAEALPLAQRALTISEKVNGGEHPSTAAALNNLALLYQATGDGARAAPFLQRALAISEKVGGPDHPDVARTLSNLGMLFLELEQREAALKSAHRAQQAEARRLAHMLSFTSEGQRLAYQQTTSPYTLPASLGDASHTLQALLTFKGIVLDSVLEDRVVAEASSGPADAQRLTALRAAKQQLMQHVLEVPRHLSAAALQARAGERGRLVGAVEEREQALARRVAEAGQTRRALRVRIADVQRALPPDTVLIEFVRYAHYRGKRRWKTRYGAAVLAASGEPRWVPLGSARALEANVAAYYAAVRASASLVVLGPADEARLRAALAGLYRQAWAPLDAALPPGTGTVLLSPDGALNVVSFATLLTPQDGFLASRYTVRYVASGRDLVRAVPPAAPTQNLVLFANPDFAGPAAGHDRADQPYARPPVERRAFVDLQLPPLPGTAREAAVLTTEARAWQWAVVRFEGPQATEAQLRGVRQPHVLHVATHGFFLPGGPGEATEPPQGRGFSVLPVAPEAPPGMPALRPPGIPVATNPMYRSGLALTGAGATLQAWARGETPPTASDGIVTAAELAELPLRGTWLVTLSACDTGTGEVRAGEGVLGLRRAVMQAGAQHLLMTLWPVDDAQTAELMVAFYAAAEQMGSAPAALAAVQRAWLERLRREQGLVRAVSVAGPFILSAQGPVQ